MPLAVETDLGTTLRRLRLARLLDVVGADARTKAKLPDLSDVQGTKLVLSGFPYEPHWT